MIWKFGNSTDEKRLRGFSPTVGIIFKNEA